ncbi:putative protein phosphatase 2C 49-like [Dorcoceras hygrometricum]|uniref:Splicing factor 3B subunit 1-like n=1 Tax=Dorcoceras hygrometricum TaxID=472368 RepID=A0A2Z7AG52_9LAMI|nr:putative protein phosphatase 2C 49-like [Dorcoceras hygrometricum]
MAAYLIHNAIQIYFDSVFSMEDEGMVQMFKALESSGLRGFLGCSSAIYEENLVDFYHNASAFPPLKILTAKSVGTYIAKNKSINAEEVLEVPVEKMVKKAAEKRRPAPAVVETAAKKKRTTVGRAAPTEKNLSIIPVVQNPEPISVVPAVTPRAQRFRAPNRKLVLQDKLDDETVENIIKQVITKTTKIETEEMETVEPVVMETIAIETDETESRIGVSSINNYDEFISFKVLSNEEGPLVEKEKEKEKIIDSEDTEPLSKVLELTEPYLSDEESMSIDDILKPILEEMMLQ